MDEQSRIRKNLIMFPLGTVGRDMMYYLFTSCIMVYVLFTRRLTDAQFAAITAIVVAARIFDALNDPIMGNIIERTRTRWGKFKPWLVIGILSSCVVVYLAFNTNLQGWSFVLFFGVIYFMYSITYTMHDISYWGMIPSLSSDADARNKFTARTTLFAGVGSTLASVLIPMLTVGQNAIGGSAKTAYGVIALVICILAPLFLCFTVFGVRENREYTDVPPVSFKKIIRTIGGNRQLLWISVIFLIQQVGNGFIISGIGGTYIYFDFGYNGGLVSLFSIIGMSATAFLMIFYPAISRRIKRKPLMTITLVISLVGYALLLAAALLLPSTMLKFWVVVMGYLLSNFGQYCFYLIMMISIMNTVEYNEYINGQRDEAIIASMRSFITKLSSAFIVLITNASYLIFGVTNYTNEISVFENQCQMGLISEAEKLAGISGVISGVSGFQTTGLLLCMALLPCILMLLSYLLYRKHYILDEEEYDRICTEIAGRKAVS
ncbi:MAG: MFS transporter [Oscillospiraceae bacterium]|nr:MFS transporter [Oscillospiraceae bacterium]